jgi:hypothetical protein
MPPFRGGSGNRVRSRDIVTQVEDKLKLNNGLPGEILEATRSSLRVLKIRNPIGCFGKYDNDTKRACALLEYDIRDYNSNNVNNNNIEIAMERLAKAAFMKLRDFRDFHEKIGNFRENLRIRATTRSNTEKKIPNDARERRRIASETSRSGIVFKKSTIPSLAIQLGAFVPNSSDVALRAKELFTEIVQLLESTSKKGGIYGLRDVQKNQSLYESACFYLLATPERSKQSNNASTRRRRRLSKEHDDGDDNQQLDLITFMNITNVSPSQFQTILDYVSKLQHEIQSKGGKNKKAPVESKRSRPSLDSLKSSRTTHSKSSRTRGRKGAFGVAQVFGAESKHNSDGIPDDSPPKIAVENDNTNFFHDIHDAKGSNSTNERPTRKRKSYSNAAFEEWKTKVLRAAYEDARERKNSSDDGDDEDREKKQIVPEADGILDLVTRRILIRSSLY